MEELKASSGAKGYDDTLQGLKSVTVTTEQPPEVDPKELAEFKSSLTLGVAGFLIVGGVRLQKRSCET